MTKTENIVSFPDLREIEEQAAAWVAKIDVRELSAVEVDTLRDWVNSSPKHEDALERMTTLWGGADILDDLNGVGDCTDDTDAYDTVESITPWWGRRMIAGAVAASVIFMVAATSFYGTGMFEGPRPTHFVTAVGEQQTIELVDGSTVILNTDSELDIEYTAESRIMRLAKGEAHFDVVPNPKRPFLVYAGDGIVKAVGTAFTVYLQDRVVEVTVSEGVVALIARPEDTFGADKVSIAVADLIPIAALTAGQNAVFAKEVEHVESMSEEALGRKLLWHDGFIAFTGDPLLSVVKDVSRYTDILIEIDPALESLPVGGYFKIGEIEGMFEALETSFGVRVERISPTHVLLMQAS